MPRVYDMNNLGRAVQVGWLKTGNWVIIAEGRGPVRTLSCETGFAGAIFPTIAAGEVQVGHKGVEFETKNEDRKVLARLKTKHATSRLSNMIANAEQDA